MPELSDELELNTLLASFVIALRAWPNSSLVRVESDMISLQRFFRESVNKLHPQTKVHLIFGKDTKLLCNMHRTVFDVMGVTLSKVCWMLVRMFHCFDSRAAVTVWILKSRTTRAFALFL